jgi:predicted dehydrogenase
MQPVRTGVWGVGTWGEKHARVYAALETSELVGVHDESAARAAEVASRHGVRAFETADALLEACEAVSIATPTIAHRSCVERACAAGVHALVEKPMAVTVEEADAMIDAARRAGIVLQVGQVERFNPALIAARRFLHAPKFIESHRMALFQPRSLDVDVVFDLMIHDIDAVLAIVGALPTGLSAVGVSVLSENEDIANARLEFGDGCVANLTASRVSQERLRRIRFFQADAYVSVDLFEKSGDLIRIDADRLRSMAQHPAAGSPLAGMAPALAAISRVTLEVGDGEPLTLELDAFVRSLRGTGEGAASARAGREALRVAAEVRDAMKRRARLWALPTSHVS